MGAKKFKQAAISSPPEPELAASPIARSTILICAALVTVCLAIYWQTAGHNFVDTDDGLYIHHNPPVRGGLSASGILWALTSVSYYYWQPLTWLSHMTDVTLFGLEAGPHHLVNAALHALNAVVLFGALFLLTGQPWVSAGAAAIHAWHPLRVESVAWAAERKDVLAGLFVSLTVLAYARCVASRKKQDWMWMFAAGAAAVASKPTAVTLPAMLLLLDWWPLGRLKHRQSLWPLIVEKLPLFAMSGIVAILALFGQSQFEATVPVSALPLDARIWNAIHSYVIYLWMWVWPADLGLLYPHRILTTAEELGSLAILIAISGLAVALRRSAPYLLMGWLWFLGAMLPMAGLVQVGGQAYADRFTYIPMVGLAIALAWGVAALAERFRIPAWTTASASGIVLAILVGISWNQVGYWKDSRTLFERSIAVSNANTTMLINLATLSEREQKYEEALRHYQEVLQVQPENAAVRKVAGNIQFRLKNYSQALQEYKTAARDNPGDAEVHKRMALVLVQMCRQTEAISELSQMLAVLPTDTEAQGWLRTLQSEKEQGIVRPACSQSAR